MLCVQVPQKRKRRPLTFVQDQESVLGKSGRRAVLRSDASRPCSSFLVQDRGHKSQNEIPYKSTTG